jgi:Apea-like HEPN
MSDDAWQTIEPAHIDIWRSAITLLGKRIVVCGETSYTVAIDWTPSLKRYERHHSAMKYIENNIEMKLDERLMKAKFPRLPSRNTVSVTVSGKDSQGSMNVIESSIHDIFLMMSIAAPGCCDFYRAYLVGGRRPVHISLSNVHFDAALQFCLDNGWPTPRVLDLEKVMSWFETIRQGASQVPQNPMEKVLFALLHISKIDTSPLIAIWLFYAFESLLQTRVGENFSTIVRRLCLLLETNREQSELLRKRIRTLYDIRSAIVHGGFEVAHPMHNEVLDKRVEVSFDKLFGATNFGYAVLLASIQIMIERSWRFPYFDEVLRGDMAGSDRSPPAIGDSRHE